MSALLLKQSALLSGRHYRRCPVVTSKIWLAVTITLVAYVIPVPAAEQSYFQFFNWLQNFDRLFEPASSQYNSYATKAENTVLRPQSFEKTFKIIWNVPTFQCHKYGLDFSNIPKWGISQNYGDAFRGDIIALLYDPGLFPALLEANSGSEPVRRNGGVPQEGNLTEHLRILAEQIETKLIPDKDFSGVAIIDFEHWRPVWGQNFGSLNPYRRVSRSIEQGRHPFWSSSEIEKEAAKRFEKAGWQFIRRSLKTARLLRPKALWGYYGFPLCFNYTPRNQQARCTPSVMEDNERIKWLFEESSAIYPSLYYKRYGLNEHSRASFMEGRMLEALRVTARSASPSPVYPYTWLKYYDTKEFVNQNDLINSFIVPKKAGAAGVIIWGASNDVNTKEKCRALNQYVETILGPLAQQVLKTPSEEMSSSYGQNIVEQPSGGGVDTGDNNNVDYVSK